MLARFPLINSSKIPAAALLVALALTSSALTTKRAAGLIRTNPARVAISAQKLAAIDDAVNGEIAQHHLPGAVVLVARKERIVWLRAYGARALQPSREAMTTDTIFDVASLTISGHCHQHHDSG
jgi:CubicO group peptidase (beta-lactamase class C family)